MVSGTDGVYHSVTPFGNGTISTSGSISVTAGPFGALGNASAGTTGTASGNIPLLNGSGQIPNGELAPQPVTLTGDATGSGTGSFATTVSRVNGVALSGLATGLLKNTTGTGAPSIATPGLDYLTTATLESFSSVAISGSGNINLSRSSPSDRYSVTVTGTNASSLSLLDAGAAAGDIKEIFVSLPAAAPVLTIYDNSTGGTLLTTYTGNGTAMNTTLTYVYNGTGWTAFKKGAALIGNNLSDLASAATARANLGAAASGSNSDITALTGAALAVTPSTTGTVNNVNIGTVTKGTGAFTSLTANGAATFTSSGSAYLSVSGNLVQIQGNGLIEQAPINMQANNMIGFAAAYGSSDAGIARVAPSVVEINNGTAGGPGSLKLSGTMATAALTVGGLTAIKGIQIQSGTMTSGTFAFGDPLVTGSTVFLYDPRAGITTQCKAAVSGTNVTITTGSGTDAGAINVTEIYR